MSHVRSKDGTTIAYEQSGRGPALILVHGALCSRRFGPSPKLVPLLARHFSVYAYDRRGRGESGDTPRIPRPTLQSILPIVIAGLTSRASTASEPRERSAPAKRHAKERVGESEGRSPADQD